MNRLDAGSDDLANRRQSDSDNKTAHNLFSDLWRDTEADLPAPLSLAAARAQSEHSKNRHPRNEEENDDDDVTEDDEHEEDETNALAARQARGGKDEDDEMPEGKQKGADSSRSTKEPDGKLFFGVLHGHSVYSDGMCKPSELFKSAKEQNIDFASITDHSHDTARQGVKPDNPRFAEQAKVPLISTAPQLYNATRDAADKASEDGKFVAITGVEMGTIGKPGKPGLAGVNHINIFEMKEFIESVKGGRVPKRAIETGHVPEEEEFEKPEVFKIKDGDYKALVERLEQTTDSTGGRAVIQLNHPRWAQDEDPKLDDDVRGRDFGQKSFDDQDEWRERFGKFATQMEILSGEALKEQQTGEFPSQHVHAKDFAGYIEKGLHISPTFGRDSHYCDLYGTPAATGVLAEGLSRKGIMDALRERRTIATSNKDALAGYIMMNDQHLMGSIVDENDSPNVHITVTVGGDLKPDAKYTAILWGDPDIGDGELAEKMQTVHISGEDLLASKGKIDFDELEHTAGKKSAYYVEVQRRTDESRQPARMWTAPVWVEPKN